MDFDLTPEQVKRTDEIRTGAAHLRPPSETSPESPLGRQDWARIAALGAAGLCVPEEAGGSGLGALDTALCLSALSEGSADTGLAFAVAAHLLAGSVAVRDFGGCSFARSLLPGVASGAVVLANAITETGSGSDIGYLSTRARRDGDAYVIDGAKSFVSNAPLADALVVYARTSPDGGPFGTTAFLVPRNTPGLEVASAHAKMGLRTCPAAAVEFRECRVPLSHRMGAEGQGAAIFQHAMTWERACLPAVYLGQMARQTREATTHARRRRQFDRRLADFQAVSHRIVDMHQRAESARLLLLRACWLLDRGHHTADAAACSAKLAVTEAAVANSVAAMQIRGAEGYLTGSGVEQQLRDSVPSTLFSGTSEIQREIIARGLGL